MLNVLGLYDSMRRCMVHLNGSRLRQIRNMMRLILLDFCHLLKFQVENILYNQRKMIGLFFERLALLGALSSLIAAIFWPHLSPILVPFFLGLVQRLTKALGFKSELDQETSHVGSAYDKQRRRATHEHPKFNGQALRRIRSEKDSILSAHYRSAKGFSRSPLGNHQSGSFIHPSGLPITGGSILGQQQQQRLLTANQASSTPLTIFTASIIGLIVYTMIKTFSSRLRLGANSADQREAIRSRGVGNSEQPGRQRHMDQNGWLDKRKLARMSREERARQLILRHGGKNVSAAIRFLASELEKQKRQLSESLCNEKSIIQDNACQGDNQATGGPDDPDEQIGRCSCACHRHHNQANDYHERETVETAAPTTSNDWIGPTTSGESSPKRRRKTFINSYG